MQTTNKITSLNKVTSEYINALEIIGTDTEVDCLVKTYLNFLTEPTINYFHILATLKEIRTKYNFITDMIKSN